MALKLDDAVFECVKQNPDQKFTGNEIAIWIFEHYPQECAEKKNRSKTLETDDDLIQQLVREISSRRPALEEKYPELTTTEERPRKYYYSVKPDVLMDERNDALETEDFTDNSESSRSTDKQDDPDANEHHLYPLLGSYLKSQLHVLAKRIDEKLSKRKSRGTNKWLHPDLVGMEDLGSHWDPEVCQCVRERSDQRARLWSFEVKKELTPANVRICFFQAVSNSSWANLGYLVAATINAQIMPELRLLSAAHGIGVIQLDVNNPAESQILIPAFERSDVDWNSINRIAKENPDFLDYIKLVRKFHQTGEAEAGGWNLCPPEESRTQGQGK